MYVNNYKAMISDIAYFFLKHDSRESSLLPAISLVIHNWELIISQDMRVSNEVLDKNSMWKPAKPRHVFFFFFFWKNSTFKTWDKLLEKYLMWCFCKVWSWRIDLCRNFFLTWGQKQLLEKPALGGWVLIRSSLK